MFYILLVHFKWNIFISNTILDCKVHLSNRSVGGHTHASSSKFSVIALACER